MASIFAVRPPQNLSSRSCRRILNCRGVLPAINVVEFRSNNGFPLPSFRSKYTKGLQLRQRPFPISASDSSDGKSIKEEKDESKKATNGGQGPPFLTILAGFSVFFLICWIISSTVMSVIGPVVKLIASK